MYMFGMLLLLIGLGFSLISRTEEERQNQQAFLSCNGYYAAIKANVNEVGPGRDFDFRKAYPDLKGSYTSFLVTYSAENQSYFVEPLERPVWLSRESETVLVKSPQQLVSGDTIWTISGNEKIKTDFDYYEVR